MHFLENFYFKTLKFDLTNKFTYINTSELPKVKKIILNFGSKTADIKQLSSSLLTLELITKQKGVLTYAKNFNGFVLNRKKKQNAFSYELHDTFSFSELEGHYYFFNNLKKLDITITTNAKDNEEFILILKSFQMQFKNL